MQLPPSLVLPPLCLVPGNRETLMLLLPEPVSGDNGWEKQESGHRPPPGLALCSGWPHGTIVWGIRTDNGVCSQLLVSGPHPLRLKQSPRFASINRLAIAIWPPG